MSRIPEETVDRIKRETAIAELVEAAGVTLKRHGKDYLGPVPVPR